MGEYANYGKERIKIGTCEDLYYLRYDQRHQIDALPGNVDPCNPEHLKELRFRFPFPWEDQVEPGAFTDHSYGFPAPAEFTLHEDGHETCQFSNPAGYLVSLPCPESKEGKAFQETHKIHRNGWLGGVSITQQKWVDGALWTVARCNGCGRSWRLPPEEGLILAKMLRNRAARLIIDCPTDGAAKNMNAMAARIEAGYAMGETHEKTSQPATTVAH
jgi:hypothetical protein